MNDEEHRRRLEDAVATQQAVEFARSRSRRLMAWAAIISSVCVAICVTTLFVVIVGRNRSEADNGRRIEELSAELSAARSLLATSNAAERAVADCASAFAGQIAVTLSDYLATLGDLVVVAVTTPPDERAPIVQMTVDRLRGDLVAYRAAVLSRDEWQRDGAVLPCPIETGG